MTMKELVARLDGAHAEMTRLLGLANSAKSEGKADQAAQYMAAFNVKQEEFRGLQGEFANAKALDEVARTAAEAKALIAPGQSVNVNPADPPKPEAHPADAKSIVVGSPEEDARQKYQFFMTWVKSGAKALDGRAFDAIRARDGRIADRDGQQAVDMPAWMFRSMVHDDAGGAKAVLSSHTTGGSTDSGAGKLFPHGFLPQLLEKPVYQPMIFDRCRREVCNTGQLDIPVVEESTGGGNFGGVAFTWKAASAEGSDKGSTDPTFRQASIITYELSGYCEVTARALRRPEVDLQTWLTQTFGNAWRHQVSLAVLRGAGAGSYQPTGILTTVGAVAAQCINRATASQVSWADITNLEFGITKAVRNGAVFIMDDSVEKYLKQDVDSEGRPLFTADTANSIRDRIAGYPYEAHEHGPTLGTKGDVMFGNLSNYVVAVEEGMAIARSDEVGFKTNTIVFRLISMVGGGLIIPSTFSVLDVPAGT
jgi:HK97 family phage major capsid protein